MIGKLDYGGRDISALFVQWGLGPLRDSYFPCVLTARVGRHVRAATAPLAAWLCGSAEAERFSFARHLLRPQWKRPTAAPLRCTHASKTNDDDKDQGPDDFPLAFVSGVRS